AVLTAIAIPVFTTQLEKSREATDIANVRSAYAEVVTEYLTDSTNSHSMTVAARQTQKSWQGEKGVIVTQVNGKESKLSYNARTTGSSYTVKINNSGTVTVN
ncbi:MAG: hypothetical protein IJ695_06555, partial [Butyrivibrio sp.]|nr:hypothetical protein [Butyrivibrio sp.]